MDASNKVTFGVLKEENKVTEFIGRIWCNATLEEKVEVSGQLWDVDGRK